jgi:hypothetical protein
MSLFGVVQDVYDEEVKTKQPGSPKATGERATPDQKHVLVPRTPSLANSWWRTRAPCGAIQREHNWVRGDTTPMSNRTHL